MTQQRLPQAHEYQHLGAFMRDLRLYYQLQIADVATRLHIRAKYIQAIEDGALEILPSKIYARGYIANYAEFLGLDGEATATQYMGEKAAAKEPVFFVPEPKRAQRANSLKSWHIAAGLIVALMLGAYVLRPLDDVEIVIEQVPDRLVESMRNAVMPMPSNVTCLTGDDTLACVQAGLSINGRMREGWVEAPAMQWNKAKSATVIKKAIVPIIGVEPDGALPAPKQILQVPQEIAPVVPAAADSIEVETEIVPDAAIDGTKPTIIASPPMLQAPQLDAVDAIVNSPTPSEAPKENLAQESQDSVDENTNEEDSVDEVSKFFSGFTTPASDDPNAPQEVIIPRRRR